MASYSPVARLPSHLPVDQLLRVLGHHIQIELEGLFQMTSSAGRYLYISAIAASKASHLARMA